MGLVRRSRACFPVTAASSFRLARHWPIGPFHCSRPTAGPKHAIKGFTQSIRCELLHAHSNVRICMVHMPALNTPQFEWVLSRPRNRPRPVPPIYQPEVAADAMLFAAEHPRREIWVGETTTATLVANKLVAGCSIATLRERDIDRSRPTITTASSTWSRSRQSSIEKRRLRR
jgi:hypothetical protein